MDRTRKVLFENLLDAILDEDDTEQDEALSDTDMDENALLRRMGRDRKRLKLLRRKKQQQVPNQPTDQSRKKLLMAQDAIQGYMVKAMEEGGAKGFAYGIIPENGRPVSVASANLKGWWQEKVRFHRDAPAAVAKYNSENAAALRLSLLEELNGAVTSTAEMLKEFQDSSLCCLLSALMPHCSPPQRSFPLAKGAPPPWWPTAEEDWWTGLGDIGRPPYKKPHDLKKAWKVGVIVGVIKHMSGDMSKVRRVVNCSTKLQVRMSSKECELLSAVLDREERQRNSSVDEAAATTAALEGGSSSSTIGQKRKVPAVELPDAGSGTVVAPGFSADVPIVSDLFGHYHVGQDHTTQVGSQQEVNVDVDNSNLYIPQVEDLLQQTDDVYQNEAAAEAEDLRTMNMAAESFNDPHWLDNFFDGL